MYLELTSISHNLKATDEISERSGFLPDFYRPNTVVFMLLLTELAILLIECTINWNFDIDWQLVGVRSLFILIVILCITATIGFLPNLFSKGPVARITLFALTNVLLTTLLVSILSQMAFPGIFPGDSVWIARNLFIAILLASILLRYFYITQRVRLLERSALEANLDALRARIRPHFLFNALNSVASLIYLDQEKAETAIETLAALFRSSLRTTNICERVSEEIERCKLYLDIESLRLGDRLKVVWKVDAQAAAAIMPAMILQPLIENSVYHGISELPQGGTIVVRISVASENVQLNIENPIPLREGRNSGLNIALDNIKRRLAGIYADSMKFSTEIGAGKFSVNLTYPLEIRT